MPLPAHVTLQDEVRARPHSLRAHAAPQRQWARSPSDSATSTLCTGGNLRRARWTIALSVTARARAPAVEPASTPYL